MRTCPSCNEWVSEHHLCPVLARKPPGGTPNRAPADHDFESVDYRDQFGVDSCAHCNRDREEHPKRGAASRSERGEPADHPFETGSTNPFACRKCGSEVEHRWGVQPRRPGSGEDSGNGPKAQVATDPDADRRRVIKERLHGGAAQSPQVGAARGALRDVRLQCFRIDVAPSERLAAIRKIVADALGMPLFDNETPSCASADPELARLLREARWFVLLKAHEPPPNVSHRCGACSLRDRIDSALSRLAGQSKPK